MAIVSGYMKDWYVIVSQHDDIEEEHNTCEWNVRYQWNERNIYQSISKMFVSIQNDMKTKTEIENKMPLIFVSRISLPLRAHRITLATESEALDRPWP